MDIVGDRFVVLDNGGAVDLATGDPATLTIARCGDRVADVRWAIRCDRLIGLRHEHMAVLLDYGRHGPHERFEAWACAGDWIGPAAERERVVRASARFLQALACTSDPAGEATVQGGPDGPVYVPGPESAYEAPADLRAGITHQAASDIEECGLSIITRPSVTALGELFRSVVTHPRAVSLWGAPGAGVDVAALLVARAARLHGYVPVAAHLLAPPLLAALRGRSLLLIERRQPAHGWQALATAATGSPRPHVVLFVGRQEVPGVPGVGLARFTVEALVDAVIPQLRAEALGRRIERCARHARGLPGRFAALLWRRRRQGARIEPARPWISVAAERPLPYGDEPPRGAAAVTTRDAREWPAPAEIVTLRRRLDLAIEMLNRGRHASGERGLRASTGGLARRGQWLLAARGGLALARSLSERGKPREAQAALADANRYAEHAGDESLRRDVSVCLGSTWIDLARLQEAEHILHAGVLAAGPASETAAADARLALARCLFWRGRYAEAERMLPVRGDAVQSAAVRASIAASRLATARGDLAGGVGTAAEAIAAAERLADSRLIAEAACAASFAHLATGDRASLSREVTRAVVSARAAHAPLVAIRARLLSAEMERRAGRDGVARALVERVQRLSGGSLPPILRARSALLLDLLGSSRPLEVLRRHIAATGLHGLAAFVPAESPADRARLQAALDHAHAILQCCHTTDDDAALLPRIASLVRTALGAAGVVFFAPAAAACLPVAGDGGRIDPAIAERTLSIHQAISPHVHEGVIEAAAPIAFGGDTLGALAARWTLGSTVDAGAAMSLLTMAAAAAAPVVAAVTARRSMATAAATGELLGVSAAMIEVRRAVDRAAPAPFAVLIEGESGCGKELVARALHRTSPRRDRPFCAVNCAALPDDLVEAELFGHARGAFTGAIGERPGVFEEAHTGTLFLDEIGELSPRAQAKLLRTIQESEVRRVGENVSRRVDVRIVAATNRNLRDEARAGRFRVDLLYRLDVLRIAVPPLRDRREDIPVLAMRFWHDATSRVGSRAVLSTASLAMLARYDWPGNVRELQNVLAALAVRSPRRGVVPPTALPPNVGAGPAGASGAAAAANALSLEAARRGFEERFVRAALVRTGGHRTRTAEELGVTRQGLTKLMARLGIGDPPAASP